jgi:hypothetical protein
MSFGSFFNPPAALTPPAPPAQPAPSAPVDFFKRAISEIPMKGLKLAIGPLANNIKMAFDNSKKNFEREKRNFETIQRDMKILVDLLIAERSKYAAAKQQKHIDDLNPILRPLDMLVYPEKFPGATTGGARRASRKGRKATRKGRKASRKH